MKFSIVIPTKNRLKTAVQAIQSCLNSNYKNLEIVVSDTSDQNYLYNEVKGLNDDRIKYFFHDDPLSMSHNWEFGVNHASGDYISVIGDDDALMPDGLLFCKNILESLNVPVIRCNCPTYKWPDYPFINRRNGLTLKIPTRVKLVEDPRKILRNAYNFKNHPGTGPGIYHGIVSKEFLEDLRQKRGRYFASEMPDFDSGFATLLYADRFINTSYPIFISGHCASSNSGRMRIRSFTKKSVQEFSAENNTQPSDYVLKDCPELEAVQITIITAMEQILPEVNKVLAPENLKINKQGAFDYLVGSISGGYESTSYRGDYLALKRLAKRWSVSDAKLPDKKLIAMGSLSDKGVDSYSIKNDAQVSSIGVDCSNFSVTGILDVIPIVNSMTTDWHILLNHIGVLQKLNSNDQELLENSQNAAIDLIKIGKEDDGIAALEKIIKENPIDPSPSFLLGAQYYNTGQLLKAIPPLARSLSLKFELVTFKCYFQTLIKDEQYDLARQTCLNYKENLNELEEQLYDHYLGLVEIAQQNYTEALSILKNIKKPFDESLLYYCEAYLKFQRADFLSAQKCIKIALSLKGNDSLYIELQKIIEENL